MKSVKVIVLGSVASGKSTVAELIYRALSKEFHCTKDDPEFPEVSDIDIDKRVKSLRASELKISIEPIPLNRQMFDKDITEVSVREIFNSASGI